MIKELDYLVTLCRAHIFGESITLDETLNFEKLYMVASRHNLSPLAYAVINTSENKDVVPKNVFSAFENDFFESVVRYGIQKTVMDELSDLLSENKIPHIFFKGAVIKELYPVPEARVMGDVDVLINVKDRDTVKALLIESGFECEKENGPVYNYRKDNVLIEMHTKIISGRVGSSNAEKYFENAVSFAEFNGFTGALERNYHFAYLIAHIAHHFWFYGAGIKLIVDLAVILRNCSIDISEVLSILSEVGLEDFAKVILTLCSKWFLTDTDFGSDTAKTEEFLLSYGAFGNVNRNNAAVIERKELEEGKAPNSLKTKLRLLFPPYEKLKNIDYISFIEGKPYLTPAAWVYRFYYNLKYKRSFVKNSVKAIGSDETKGDAEKEFAYFKEIGLL